MKTLVADCGATKAEWYVSGGEHFTTEGISFSQTSPARREEILREAASKAGAGIRRVFFYAAGLVGESPVDLREFFSGAQVEYASDLLGAARAVCGHREGIAAILGTGAATCQWDGEKPVRQIPSGGFILGDEGSASALGRLFVADFLKGLVPEEMDQAFGMQFPRAYKDLVEKVYRSDAPARFLGSTAPLVLDFCLKGNAYATKLVTENFRAFFERTVLRYDRLPLGIVGGFGYAARDILQQTAASYGIQITTIEPSPMEALVKYHGL